MSLTTRLAALLGVSTFQVAAPSSGPSLGDPQVEAVREAWGGQLAPVPYTQTRWHLGQVDEATRDADAGNLAMAARLWNACQRDGVLVGVLSTRTGGLVRLPKKFRGDAEIVAELELGHDSVRSVFDEMFPPAELEKLAADGIGLGVGVATLERVEGRAYPVLVRQPPENLVYRWAENRWYYRTIAGLLPITPGDGHWVLHIPGGRIAPWQQGIWRAVGRAYTMKEGALSCAFNWQMKLANPARVAVAPQATPDPMREAWVRQVMAWGINTVFSLLPGWDVKLIESNGNGYQTFDLTRQWAEREFIVAVAGQEVTTDGGTGFANADIHKSIRADLIKATADALAYTINTQGITAYVVEVHGEAALDRSPQVEWDVTPPKDRASEANAQVATANAIKGLREALQMYQLDLDIGEVCKRAGIPVRDDANHDGKPDTVAPVKPETSEPLVLEEAA